MLKMRSERWIGVLLLVGLLSLGGRGAFAQSPATFTLQPGGKATVSFEAFCTNFGQKFPQSVQAPNDVAPDKIRGALAYIQSNNLAADQAKALDAQYAIWQLSGATGSPAGGTDAQAVVAAAANAPATPSGTTVVDAVKANQVKVTVDSWQPTGNKVQLGSATDNFYGHGTLTVENTSQQAVTLTMPVGTLFPPTTAGEQTMAGYATNVQVNNPQPAPTAAQLPNTGSESTPLAILFLVALGLLGTGGVLRLNRMGR
jgi:LPXTG-motif cell wall-anchored protein